MREEHWEHLILETLMEEADKTSCEALLSISWHILATPLQLFLAQWCLIIDHKITEIGFSNPEGMAMHKILGYSALANQ